jgi:serine/threonine protein phosphatase PrpC
MRIFGITDRGCVREQNQDAYDFRLLDQGRGLAVVCDGMGGAKAGNVASTMAVERFFSTFLAEDYSDNDADIPQMMTAAADAANSDVYHRSVTDADCRGMGTTLVAAFADPECVQVLNEGDSRAYYINQSGISRVTRDHSLVQHLLERGDITVEEARSHPQKNLITRALGAEPELRADLYQLDWAAGEFLLLCSDGLSNTVSDQELLYEVLHGGTPESCCDRLLDIALKRGAPDNVTAVLITND